MRGQYTSSTPFSSHSRCKWTGVSFICTNPRKANMYYTIQDALSLSCWELVGGSSR